MAKINMKEIIQELNEQKELMDLQEASENSGSDSNPSEDELNDEDLITLLPKSVLSKNQRRIVQENEEEKIKKKETPPDNTPKVPPKKDEVKV